MKEMKLSGRAGLGLVVMVDDDIYEQIKYKSLKYRDGSSNSRSPYVYWTETVNGTYKYVRLHRYVFGETKKNEMVDHIDTNPLNCQRRNLRLATRKENNRNRKSFKNSSSQYKCVAWDKHKKKWRVQIGYENRLYFIGYFDDVIDAARNADWHAIQLHKDFAKLNFPEFCYDEFVPTKRELK